MRIVREHGMRQEEAMDLMVEKLPSLIELLAGIIEEAAFSEEGLLYWADNYWDAEFIEELEPRVDEDICKLCGQQVNVLNEGPMSIGGTFRIWQCPCCGDSNCPHQYQQNGV